MTTPGYVQVPADSSGKKVDTSEQVRGTDGATVERQNVVISDPTDELGRAKVLGEDGRGALAVSGDIDGLLRSIDYSLKQIVEFLSIEMSN
jgi:hypothetical protein